MKKSIYTLIFIGLGLWLSSAASCESSSQECQNCDEYDHLIEYGESFHLNSDLVWTKVFQDQLSKSYDSPEIIYFNGTVDTQCASNKSGTHYCPYNDNIYIDLPFMDRIKSQYNGQSNYGIAYIMAHEMGHHIQDQLGIVASVQLENGNVSDAEYRDFLKRLELQADFLAGVWAHHSHNMTDFIDPDDFVDAIEVADMLGDDYVNPNRPSVGINGTGLQRSVWFLKGLETGDLEQGNTFVVDL